MIFLLNNFALIALLTWVVIFVVYGFYLRGVFKISERNEVFTYFNVFVTALIFGIIAGRISYVLFNLDFFKQFSFYYTPIVLYDGPRYIKVLPYVLFEIWNGLDITILTFTFLISGMSLALNKYKLPKVRIAKTLLNISLIYLCFQVASYLFLSSETPPLVIILLCINFVVYLSGFLLRLLESSNQTIINYLYFSLLVMNGIFIVVDSIVIGGFKNIMWFVSLGILVIIGFVLFVLSKRTKTASRQPKIDVVMKDWK